MRTFSNDFRSSLNEIRQLNGKVCYYSTDSYYILTTESGDYLATEDENYLATEKGYITYDAEAINSIRPIFNVNLFKTVCKSIEIEAVHKIDKGIPVCAKIGVLVNGTYEYMDYGNYKIIDEPTYQADTKSYLMIGYDKMIESMVKYDDNPLSITYPITHKNLVIAICNHFNWTYNLGNYTNYDKTIDTDLYLGQDMTYRDILDDLCQATGTNFLFTLADVFTTKDITETNTTIDDNYIKDINVNFGEKYGKVNALTITSEGTTFIDNKEDSTSIVENGKTEFNINNNKLLLYASELFIDDLFNKINGLEYYTYDIDTTGLLVYEPLDRFTINHNGVDYSCVMFNNDTQLTKGLKEIIYTDKPEETENEYISNTIDDKKINNAIVSINKAKGQVVLKANSDGKVVQATLNADADSGSEFTVKADNINLEGYTTINGNFAIDESGNASLKDSVIEMYKDGQKLAEFNTNGIDFYNNGNKTITMGSETITSSGIGGSPTEWDSAVTSVLYGQAIWWLAQRSQDSEYYDPILWFTNFSGEKNLLIGTDAMFKGSVQFNDYINGGLAFADETRAKVITTSDSYNDNVWISRIVGDGLGNLLANSWLGTITISGHISDERFKKNIKLSKEKAIDKINKINIYEFDFKENGSHTNNGVIAQQLEKIDETLVIKNDDGKGIYQINTLNLLSLAIKGIKEQQTKIDYLEEKINKLEVMINEKNN